MSEHVHRLCSESHNRAFARARNAQLIMSNAIPEITTDDDTPYCIWYPDVASEETYRQLAKRYPDMRCGLYNELGLRLANMMSDDEDIVPAAPKQPYLLLTLRRLTRPYALCRNETHAELLELPASLTADPTPYSPVALYGCAPC
ncbi:uncharacterized protein LY79DRAFT_579572 [Colletotrichum navitas]|uniref:Uncharacterized protein n=1 Tax=Colletotrichum navitas TaxID=681940 RepID=A0AAD8PZH8_9PEZI|nr:uncharacterized protein LY79DRAFT_579572 [Colletotrichum navitas]KAK1590825.1 hypothetical protein LY79DRAFT_579572 [Colletotrichum navitas]